MFKFTKFDLVIILMLMAASNLCAQNLQGFNGYFNIPSTKSFNDGTLTLSVGYINKENIKYKTGSYDAILFNANLEYLPNLELVVRLLRPVQADKNSLGLGDRSIGIKYTITNRNPFLPNIAFVINDPLKGSEKDVGNSSLNYGGVIIGKGFVIGNCSVNADLGYMNKLGNSKNNFFKNAIVAGLSIDFLHVFTLLCEYDSQTFNYGIKYIFADMLVLQAGLMQYKKISTNISLNYSI